MHCSVEAKSGKERNAITWSANTLAFIPTLCRWCDKSGHSWTFPAALEFKCTGFVAHRNICVLNSVLLSYARLFGSRVPPRNVNAIPAPISRGVTLDFLPDVSEGNTLSGRSESRPQGHPTCQLSIHRWTQVASPSEPSVWSKHGFFSRPTHIGRLRRGEPSVLILAYLSRHARSPARRKRWSPAKSLLFSASERSTRRLDLRTSTPPHPHYSERPLSLSDVRLRSSTPSLSYPPL
jgi:hypothetical protein